MLYHVLDVGFFGFHSLLIVFILFGWAWPRARRVHLVVVLLTVASWFGLGLWYGFGYCPCTEWHWRVRERLGHTDMPVSYTKFLFDQATGLDAPAAWVDAVTVAGLAAAVVLAVVVNVRGLRPSRS